MKKTYLLSFMLIIIFSCTENETIYENEHIIDVVDGNAPPPYDGVTTVQLNNYVNKIYIDLLGREPLQSELEMASQLLKDNNISDDAVDDLVNTLITGYAYHNRFFEIYSATMLNSADSTNIEEGLFIINQILSSTNDPQQILYANREIEKLNQLKNAKFDYQNNVININEFMTRMVYNFIYDNINMGTENFILATFENLFKRLPTENELENSDRMVDGFPAQLLFKDGATKVDFIEIITEDTEFYQGLVFDIYLQLLARNPNSQEMGTFALQMFNNEINYKDLQKTLIKSEEYKGF